MATRQYCMTNPNQKHILCTWEIGGDLGHLTRLANITRKLEQKNYRVTLVIKDLSRAISVFGATRATLLQAPVWLPKIGLNRPIACIADSLLLMGYLEPDGLHALYQGWQNLTRILNPNLIVYDYSPTAILANRPLGIPAISVGTGFMDPVPDNPIADWRAQHYDDTLIARQEARLLDTINTVLQREQQPTISRFSDLYRNLRTVVTTFPMLDLYQQQRVGALHRPHNSNDSKRLPIEFPKGSGPSLVAYLKHHYPHLDVLLKGLSKCNARVFVACPGGRDEQFKPYHSPRFHYSTQLVELEKGIAEADLFFGHGNMGTATHALECATPQVIIPIHLEQLITGQRIQKCGTGILIDKINSPEDLARQINAALASEELKRTCLQFRADNASLLQEELADTVVRLCGELMAQEGTAQAVSQ